MLASGEGAESIVSFEAGTDGIVISYNTAGTLLFSMQGAGEAKSSISHNEMAD